MGTYQIVDFTVPTDRRIKKKGSEKRDKLLDLTRELTQLWKMKVTEILILIGKLGTIPKVLVNLLEKLKVRRQAEISQTVALLRSVMILRRFLETCCHSDPRER